MKMLRFLFLLLVITLPLAKVLQASSQVPDKSQFITAGNYRLFLAAVAEIQDAHGLYQPEMESQIICTQDVDDKNYRIIDGQEDAPMGNMTRLNAMRYCNWQEHHCPDEKEDAVAAALSTESGFYDLQNDQLVCVHPEVGDHLVDDHEGDEFFWITTEPEEQKRLPLMMFSFFDTEKEKTNQQRDRGDIEASRLRGGDDDSSAGVQRGITARIGEYSTSASERVPGVTWCEMMKTKLLEIWDYLKRFFCWRSGGEAALPTSVNGVPQQSVATLTPIDRLLPADKNTINNYITNRIENNKGTSLSPEVLKEQIHAVLASLEHFK